MTQTAFIYVQHLLGTGHAVRAAAIGKALVARGVEVTLATGNLLPPTLDTTGLEIVQLPPAKSANAAFSRIITLDGNDIDPAWKEMRTAATLKALAAKPYDLLLTETYPFGRRQFEFELASVLDTVKALDKPPLIACSVRDILVPKNELWKEEWMADKALAYYDRVLVHADPDFITLADSFPFAHKVEKLVRYTGYVMRAGDRPEPPEGDGEDEVIVSCGGGALAEAFLSAAVDARPLSRRAGDCTWRILVGHNISEEDFQDYRKRAGEGVIVERARPDFTGMLKRARLSVSQAGYNTILDILDAGVPSVLVPFAQATETEQAQRAKALAARGRVVVAEEHNLTTEKLAQAADDALALPRSHHHVLLGGAEKSADILMEDLKARG
ncbi:glycosyltransferase family protein [Roseibium aggregatum]|uniref:Glycosyltransferase n=1 Tax=Roseibium aggregatum TaxID=187304 RepID=A0A926NVS8_9HYPH|nr:glycosyltransferase [Roseibium aggregatum]MBD1545296.1 glycosyltransferase [Roseibium aggregatum]